MKKALELPSFKRLLLVTALNETALGTGAVALALLVYRRTGSAFGATAFFLCAEFAPAFFSPLFVVRLDQGSTRRALLVLSVLEGLIFLIIAWLLGSLSVAALLALVLLDGTLGVTVRVLTRSAWTSSSSDAGALREANALIHATRSVCFMVGPALGGALVAASGTRTAISVDVVLFFLIAAVAATTRGLPGPVAEPAKSGHRLREALARVRIEPVLRRVLVLQAIGLLFFTITIPVDVIFAQRTLHAGPGGYGVLLGAWGGGTIVGSALYARWRALSSGVLMALGTLGIGGGFLAMALAPSIGVAIAGSALAGVGAGTQGAAMRTAVQESTPSEWMALILSLNESIFQAVPGAGLLLGGAIAAVAGPRTALTVAAGGSLLVALLVWFGLARVSDGVISADANAADAGQGLQVAPPRP